MFLSGLAAQLDAHRVRPLFAYSALVCLVAWRPMSLSLAPKMGEVSPYYFEIVSMQLQVPAVVAG
jgi:hypothetical protein